MSSKTPTDQTQTQMQTPTNQNHHSSMSQNHHSSTPTSKQATPNGSQTSQHQTYLNPAFSDISSEDFHEGEEKLLDQRFEKTNLIRKSIPRDGACLFSAIADQLCGTPNLHFKGISSSFPFFQSFLFLVRQKCVDFIQQHRDYFEPFVCFSEFPFDHYLFEMRKWNTWGGQIEIQALSLMFQ